MIIHLPLAKAAVAAAALASTLLLAPTSASAEQAPLIVYGDQNAVRTESVSFSSLALANKRDQRRLQRKVSAAVERVCLRNVGRAGLEDRDYYACEREAWKGASPQIAAAISRASALASSNLLNDGAPVGVSSIRISTR